MKTLELALGYTFQHSHHLKRALTHRSFGAAHNERLEFLGDAVLGLIISRWLHDTLDQASEGDLSRLRSHLVCQYSLVQIAETLTLSRYLILGLGERKTGGLTRPSILADAVEALFGAVYLDGGFAAVEEVVHRLFAPRLTLVKASGSGQQGQSANKDAKTRLQEWCQGQQHPLPDYQIVQMNGLAHEQEFEVSCTLTTPPHVTQGTGSSRRIAEQHAAEQMMAWIDKKIKNKK